MIILHFPDYWSPECVHTTEDARRVPGCVFSDGTDGCQFGSGHQHGLGPRAHVLLTLPDALWNQTFAFSRNHSPVINQIQVSGVLL